MIDPSVSLQKALLRALKGKTAAGDNVFDRVPDVDLFPRIVIGESQVLDAGVDCYDGSETFLTIHVFTRDPPGYTPCKTIVGQIRELISDETPVEGHSVDIFDFQNSQFMRDPDGLTSHGVVVYRALTQPESE